MYHIRQQLNSLVKKFQDGGEVTYPNGLRYNSEEDYYGTYDIEEVIIPYPDWARYKHEYQKNNPKEAYIQKYLDAYPYAGQSLQNYPKRLDETYDKMTSDYIGERIVKSKPPKEGSSREEYLNSLSTIEQEYVQRNPKYETSLWQDTVEGAKTIMNLGVANPSMGNALQIQRIRDSNNYTELEKQKLIQQQKDSPILSNIGNASQILSPLMVPAKIVQSGLRPEYSLKDALSGTKNKASLGEDILTDPLNLVGVGLLDDTAKITGSIGRFSKGVEGAAGVILQESLPHLNAYTQGLKTGLKTPSVTERFVPATSNLSRTEYKNLKDIKTLSSLSKERDLDPTFLYNRYLKSNLDDNTLKNISGKTRAEIQALQQEEKISGKRIYNLEEEPSTISASSFFQRAPPSLEGIINNRNVTRNFSEYTSRSSGEQLGKNIRSLFKSNSDMDNFVPFSREKITAESILPSLFKSKNLEPGDEVITQMNNAMNSIKTADKGFYNAAKSISDSSAPLYYSQASRLGREKDIRFHTDGFTSMNRLGFLNKAGVEDSKIVDYMNKHISELDFQGKKLPKAYIDENSDIQIPNLLIEKYKKGGHLGRLEFDPQKIKTQLQIIGNKYRTGALPL